MDRRFLFLGFASVAACVGDSSAPSDAGGTDATTDVVPMMEAGSDAPADVSRTDASDAGTWCTTQTFCDSFDSYADLNALIVAWNGTYSSMTSGTSLALGTGFSLPYALVATGGSGSEIYLTHAPFSKTPTKRISLEYQLNSSVGSLTGLQVSAFAIIVLGTSPNTDACAYLDVDATGVAVAWSDAVDAGGGYNHTDIMQKLPISTWDGRWGIVVSLTGSDAGSVATVTVEHDGTVIGTASPNMPARYFSAPAVTFAAGLHNVSFTGMVTVAIDDLAFDIQ